MNCQQRRTVHDKKSCYGHNANETVSMANIVGECKEEEKNIKKFKKKQHKSKTAQGQATTIKNNYIRGVKRGRR